MKMTTPSPKKYKDKTYLRIPIQTRILQSGDDFIDIIKTFCQAIIKEGDIIVISESPLAITQGRAINVKDIKIGFLANILWRFVRNVNYGIGLRAPSSMQCAIDECGTFRIFFAALIGGFTRIILRRKGDFYRIAGKQAALIDAAYTTTVTGYEECVIKGPLHPEKEAQKISDGVGLEIAIMDINDIGGSWVIGHSSKIDPELLENIMRDNPQGQGSELTPICIVREIGDQK
ncbi:MAG: coenzyme F420-0:L-glutamate ligase [Candidatus Cloacimonetes bacterium]|nr:coenzyme F420-0:L-glutamate ligase [Candidatus Cloacimonadota bacterium]